MASDKEIHFASYGDGRLVSEILVGIRAFGHRSFDYLIPKFAEMHRACIAPYADTFICGDDQGSRLAVALHIPGKKMVFQHEVVGSTYAEDVLEVADELSRQWAIGEGYKKLIWQDLDCFYNSGEDFVRLSSHDLAGVGALTAGRDSPDYAIARRFVGEDGEQEEIPDSELLAAMNKNDLLPSGFPGAGALCLRVEDMKDLTWSGNPEAIKWYDRVRQGRPGICLQEWYVWEMNKRGAQVYIDTGVRVWHVGEDGIGSRYPGECQHIDGLSW